MLAKLFASLCCFFLVVFLVHGQDQPGFISLDCGLVSGNSSYTDKMTGINYVSDSSFTDSGIPMPVSPEHLTNSTQKLWSLRSFPNGTRNCYSLTVKTQNKYLIRATFMYGNYDAKNEMPEFDIHLGPNRWDTVRFRSASRATFTEIIHLVTSSVLHVCLVNTKRGTPFISVLELRLLSNGSYVTESGSLMGYARLDLASATNRTIRYSDDAYDRLWLPFNRGRWRRLSASSNLDDDSRNEFAPPSEVMRTAATPVDTDDPIILGLEQETGTLKLYVFMYFTEVQELRANEQRAIDIIINGEEFVSGLIPQYMSPIVIYKNSSLSSQSFQLVIQKSEGSTLPPILNAIEIYVAIEMSERPTDGNDTDAITNIKSAYSIKKNWQGDPCAPQGYIWDGLTCSNNDTGLSRITALNLSSSRLTGEISHYISRLSELQNLDLSKNNLTGSVPDFLSQLLSLRLLDLSGNQLRGPLPAELLERSRSGSLLLRFDGNPDLCSGNSCQNVKESAKKKTEKEFLVPLLASVAGFFFLVAVAVILLWFFRRRKKRSPSIQRTNTEISTPSQLRNVSTRPSLQRADTGFSDTGSDLDFDQKSQKLTYSQIVSITNNFARDFGRGSSGKIYLGYLDGKQVTVKMLSPVSSHGYKQLKAEVKHLFRVHHRNLSSLIGYCNEGNKIALVYEYMANGNLKQHLTDAENSTTVFSWEDRLRIAIDVARGLEYLHNGCKPPIIHRNVKCTNIFLDESFHAKLGGFGLSREFNEEEGSHVYTVIAGTPGYVDPEYYTSNKLTEKSDVYSFGVVLLELITAKPAIIKLRERIHISQWVESILTDIESIVDPKLLGDYEPNSAWKFVDLAMSCVSQDGRSRPAMSEIVKELNEILNIEVARKERLQSDYIDSPVIPMPYGSNCAPMLR